jgi:hypothetical protein
MKLSAAFCANGSNADDPAISICPDTAEAVADEDEAAVLDEQPASIAIAMTPVITVFLLNIYSSLLLFRGLLRI